MRIKSNARMPARTRANIEHFTDCIRTLPKPHREEAERFQQQVTPVGLFEILHSMRRWYSGQTMARRLLAYRDHLRQVMDLEPSDAVGVFRGFHAPRDSRLAGVLPGQTITLPVTRNHGFSSWSTAEAPVHRFSGASRDRVGLVVRLADERGVTPVLAPPERTVGWFNRLYERCVGTSFRKGEREYLLAAPRVRVEVVRVKR
jgi:hypothetical protein